MEYKKVYEERINKFWARTKTYEEITKFENKNLTKKRIEEIKELNNKILKEEIEESYFFNNAKWIDLRFSREKEFKKIYKEICKRAEKDLENWKEMTNIRESLGEYEERIRLIEEYVL